jgi:hypothetical protein
MRTATALNPVSLDELRQMAAGRFGNMVKAVVDVRRGIMVLGAEMHADEESELLADGSAPQDLWGINISRGVDDAATRDMIADLVRSLVQR